MAGAAVRLISFIIFLATRFSSSPMNLVYGRLSQSESLEIVRQIELSGTKFHLLYNSLQVVRSGQDVHLVMIKDHSYIN